MAVSTMVASAAATAAGTGMAAIGKLNSGNAAQQAGQYQAAQDRENEGQAIASSQRQMLDTQQKTRLLQSKAIANAGASGVNAAVGSPATDVGSIAQRGAYNAGMDLFRGRSTATGLENQAEGAIWSGNVAQQASQLGALGTVAGGAGSMLSSLGRFYYPGQFGGPK